MRALTPGHPVPLPALAGAADAVSDASCAPVPTILSAPSAHGDLWVLLVPPTGDSVHINGCVVVAGLAVLRHRDEITIGDHFVAYFSSETPPEVAPLSAGSSGPVPCARCTRVIDVASPAVRCPLCGAAHHAAVDRQCWGYAETCATTTCSQLTDLEAGPRFVPEFT